MARRYGAFSRMSPTRAGRGARKSVQGQGGMRALFSGAVPVIRHSVQHTVKTIADGKAYAYPLVVYYGTSGSSNEESASASVSKDSRVNHVSVNLSISQSDTSKSNQCYIGLIATSFSDGALNDANMTSQFADLIKMDNETTGTMNLTNGAQDLTYREWNVDAAKRHWIRGFQRNTYTLYSGRPALLNTVLRVPAKCKRAQFGMGWWLVIMNDSALIQNESSGSASAINVSLETAFKEIPPTAYTVS